MSFRGVSAVFGVPDFLDGRPRKVFFTVMRHYFSSEEGGERSVCLSFAFLFLLLAMLALVVREEYLEFGLDAGG